MERGAHAGAGLLSGLVTRGGPTLEQSVPEGLQAAERTHTGEVHGGLSPVGGTPHWSRGRVRSPAPEEEGAAETRCEELTPTPIPCPPVLLAGRRQRKLGVKLCLGRRQGWGGRENWE